MRKLNRNWEKIGKNKLRRIQFFGLPISKEKFLQILAQTLPLFAMKSVIHIENFNEAKTTQTQVPLKYFACKFENR